MTVYTIWKNVAPFRDFRQKTVSLSSYTLSIDITVVLATDTFLFICQSSVDRLRLWMKLNGRLNRHRLQRGRPGDVLN